MGRPLLRPEQRKDFCHSIYFFKEEYYRVAREAVRADMHISEYIRQAVLGKMKEKDK